MGRDTYTLSTRKMVCFQQDTIDPIMIKILLWLLQLKQIYQGSTTGSELNFNAEKVDMI